jgi:hypothetical protein
MDLQRVKPEGRLVGQPDGGLIESVQAPLPCTPTSRAVAALSANRSD